MQRVMVMGPPGAGKSTLARRLGARHGLPAFHLDQAFHLPGWVQAPEAVFRAEVERLAALPRWVIDGNYTGSAAPRLAAAELVIYLDVPTRVSMVRVVRRLIGSFGRVRADGPAGCPEKFNFEFLWYVWTWNRKHRAALLAVVQGFAGRKVVLRGRRDVEKFLLANEGGTQRVAITSRSDPS
jgi:adenylate kinase family enzyme